MSRKGEAVQLEFAEAEWKRREDVSMTLSDGFSGFASLAAVGALFLSLFKGAKLQGADSQRLGALEQRLNEHASSDTVIALGGRVDELEADMKQVAAAVTEVSVVKEKVMGLDRLVTSQLDEIKHTLRRLEERSFDPAMERLRKPQPS